MKQELDTIQFESRNENRTIITALDKEDILEGMNTPIEECIPESEVEWTM